MLWRPRVAAASITALTPVPPVGPGVQVQGPGAAELAAALATRGATPGNGTRVTVVGSGARTAAASATDVGDAELPSSLQPWPRAERLRAAGRR